MVALHIEPLLGHIDVIFVWNCLDSYEELFFKLVVNLLNVCFSFGYLVFCEIHLIALYFLATIKRLIKVWGVHILIFL